MTPNRKTTVGAVSDREKIIRAPVGAVSDRENLYAAQATPKNFWARLVLAWATLLGRIPNKPTAQNTDRPQKQPEPTQEHPSELLTPPQRNLQPYNPQALPAAREQWQRGDWASLASLTLDELQDHPDRAKLALLAGIGKLNYGHKQDEAKDAIRMSAAWGCDTKIIKKMLVTNTFHTLERAAVLTGNKAQAQRLSIKALQTTPIKIS